MKSWQKLTLILLAIFLLIIIGMSFLVKSYLIPQTIEVLVIPKLEEIIKHQPDYTSLTLAALREVPEQQPFVAKEALSYTGTVFKNTSGVGVQLPVSAENSKIPLNKFTLPQKSFGNGMLAVPVTRLYDRGIMIRTSEISP